MVSLTSFSTATVYTYSADGFNDVSFSVTAVPAGTLCVDEREYKLRYGGLGIGSEKPYQCLYVNAQMTAPLKCSIWSDEGIVKDYVTGCFAYSGWEAYLPPIEADGEWHTIETSYRISTKEDFTPLRWRIKVVGSLCSLRMDRWNSYFKKWEPWSSQNNRQMKSHDAFPTSIVLPRPLIDDWYHSDFDTIQRHWPTHPRSDEYLANPYTAIKAAIDGTKTVNINVLDYTRDLPEIASIARTIASIKTGNPAEVIKSSSQLYLTVKYGLMNLFRDTDQLGQDLARISKSQLQSTSRGSYSTEYHDFAGNTWEYDSHAKLLYEPIDSSIRTGYETLQENMSAFVRENIYADSTITAENLWDLIPFSFIVDWFLPLGDALAVQDDNNYIHVLPVRSLTVSERITRTGSWDSLGLPYEFWSLPGSATVSFYKRTVHAAIPTIPPLSTLHTPQGLTGHYAESAALLIANWH